MTTIRTTWKQIMWVPLSIRNRSPLRRTAWRLGNLAQRCGAPPHGRIVRLSTRLAVRPRHGGIISTQHRQPTRAELDQYHAAVRDALRRETR